LKDPYKNIAKWYDLIFEPLNSGLWNIGIKMYPPQKEMTVLDIGCGTGSFLKLYQKEGCNVFGIDLSPTMLKEAQKKLGETADLRLCNATATNFPGGKFDIIISSTVLHEMPIDVRLLVLKEAKRILAKDGRVLLIDFHPDTEISIKGLYTKIIITIAELLAGRDHYKNYRHFIRNGGLPSLIDSTKLKIVDHKIVGGGNLGIFLLKK
jgi:demethylmenaquinone methyltransferase/2-methoxy-6-polyprenyl-1,4-benzoquinol methylase